MVLKKAMKGKLVTFYDILRPSVTRKTETVLPEREITSLSCIAFSAP